MEKYTPIIILSSNYQTENENILVISNKCVLNDDAHLTIKDDIYTFEYLILTDTSLITNFLNFPILQENDLPITNCLFQTSIENIYYTKDENIEIALQNIIENN